MKRKRQGVWKDDRGQGSVFFFVNAETNRKVSSNLYVSYRAEGKEIVVSAKTDDEGDAKKLLRRLTRNRENAREALDVLKTPKVEKITVGELLDANLIDVKEKKRESARQIEWRSEILKKLLGSVRALDFRPEHVDEYKRLRRLGKGSRRGAKVGDVTIRRELECLTRAFSYAVERGVLRTKPFIAKPANSAPREVEPSLEVALKALRAMKNADARDGVDWFLLTAMRPKGILKLRWEWLDRSDRDAWTLSVPSEKRGNAREYAITGSLRAVIERRLFAKREGCPYIFHGGGKRRDARWLRRHWYKALAACELPTGVAGFTLYDLKRTAIGLLFDSDLTEAAVQHFSGHKTSPMVQRYYLKNADRHRVAVQQRDEHLAKRLAQSGGESRRKSGADAAPV
jgi:integrase